MIADRRTIPAFVCMIYALGVVGCTAQPSRATALPASPPSSTRRPATTTLAVDPSALPRTSPTPSKALPPTATPERGAISTSHIDGAVMVYVPAGPFLMGSSDQDVDNEYARALRWARPVPVREGFLQEEQPQHQIILDSFWIDRSEVSNRMFALCVDAGGCEPPASTKAVGRGGYYDNPKYADYPVASVDWSQARDYCAWAGRRLPTEAEWEKAARGTDGRRYPWGKHDPTCDVSNHGACARNTVPIYWGKLGASPFGALNMAGNVSEWVSSLYWPYPYDSDDGREDLEAQGERVARGGAWSSCWDDQRTARRLRFYDNPMGLNSKGFRCALTP